MSTGVVLDIATAPRSLKPWTAGTIGWADLLDRLAHPDTRSKEAAGGYVLGRIDGIVRDRAHMIDRCALTLDADDAQCTAAELVAKVGHRAAAHSTWRHTPDKPRLRLIVPLDRRVTPEEYTRMADAMMDRIGGHWSDRGGREPERFMYWPATPDPDAYQWHAVDGPLLAVDEVLASLPTPEPPRSPEPPRPPAGSDLDRQPYLDAAVRNVCDRLAACPEGGYVSASSKRPGRANGTHECAVVLGSYITGAGLPRAVAEDALLDAARRNGVAAEDGERSIREQIRRGLDYGEQDPKPIPERVEDVDILTLHPRSREWPQDPQNRPQDARGDDPGNPAPEEPEPAQEAARAWRPVDLTAYLNGTHKTPEPVLMPRTDGLGLLYAGLTHSLHGESESGKSLVAQAEAARVLNAGARVLFLDFESDPGSVIERLRMLGADSDAIAERFTYLCPDVDPRSSAAEAAAWLDVLSGTYELAVIDGVTASLGVFGGATKDNDNITAWTRLLPDGIARRTGAAVVSIDHVTKDPETRGRFAIGGQAKMAALTGAAYVVEVAEPLGRGLRGVVVLRVAKDRPGFIRARGGEFRGRDRTQEIARVVVDSTGPSTVVTVEPPHAAPGDGQFRPTALMERASRHLEAAGAPLGLNAWRDGFSGNREAKREAIAQLVAEGFATVADGPNRSKVHTLARPYRQAEDPLSDRFAGTPSAGTHPVASSGAFLGGEWVPPLQSGTHGPTHPVGPGPTQDPPGPTGPTDLPPPLPDPSRTPPGWVPDQTPARPTCNDCGRPLTQPHSIASGRCESCYLKEAS